MTRNLLGAIAFAAGVSTFAGTCYAVAVLIERQQIRRRANRLRVTDTDLTRFFARAAHPAGKARTR